MSFFHFQSPFGIVLLLLRIKGLNILLFSDASNNFNVLINNLAIVLPFLAFLPSIHSCFDRETLCARLIKLDFLADIGHESISMENCVVILITLLVSSQTNALQCNSVLQCANKLEVEVDLQSGRVIPSVDAASSQVSFLYGPTASSSSDRCDGQAVVRLDFSGPYKKAKIELIYGAEPLLWTASISDAPTSYGFGSNYGYSSNCAAAEVFNHQFRVYSNKQPGFMYDSKDGNSLMALADEVVEKGANMTIDIADEAIFWKTHFTNSSAEPYRDYIKNSRHLFTLSGQEPTFGPPTDSYVYAGFNRVPYGNFHNGSGLCRVRITFRRELGKGK